MSADYYESVRKLEAEMASATARIRTAQQRLGEAQELLDAAYRKWIRTSMPNHDF